MFHIVDPHLVEELAFLAPYNPDCNLARSYTLQNENEKEKEEEKKKKK